MNVKPSTPSEGMLTLLPMGAYQAAIIGIMLLLNVMDGFDVLAMSFAAPGIARELQLSPSELGWLFSAGFVGMAAGALFISPLADQLGRRPVLMISLILITAGMLACPLVGSLTTLSVCRFSTGAGIGALLPTINAVAMEFSNQRRRSLAVGVSATGMALGGLIGGIAAGILLKRFDWQSIFYAGGALSLTGLVAVMVLIPETPDWLSQSHDGLALQRLNRVLVRLGKAPVDRLPERSSAAAGPKVKALLSHPFQRTTILMSVCYFLVMIGYYSFMSWTPKLTVDHGIPTFKAVQLVTFATAGSVIGGVGFGLFARLSSIVKVTWVGFVFAALAVAAFSKAEGLPLQEGCSLIFGATSGFALTGLLAIFGEAYPAYMRATGSGFVFFWGRVGAMVGPTACGFLLSAHRGDETLYDFMAIALAMGAVAVGCIRLTAPSDRPVPKRDAAASLS